MIKLPKTNRTLLLVGKILCACLLVVGTVIPLPTAHAHPVEFHMGPLDASAVERVLVSLNLLLDELKSGNSLDTANLPDGALGITAILWSIEGAVAAMDKSWSTKSPSMLRALQSAGYEDSPYIVAEWKIEAERVLEAYEALSENYQEDDIFAELAELEKEANNLTDEERVRRESTLIRKASMLQTTARDISQIAPFKQRFDQLTKQLTH